MDRPLVFVSGSFETIDVRTIRLLMNAAELGTVIAAIEAEGHSDLLESRLEVLKAIKYVDYLVVYNEATPIRLIQIIQPDYLVKPLEDEGKELPEYSIAKRFGTEIVFVDDQDLKAME